MATRRARVIRSLAVVLAGLAVWSGCASGVRAPKDVADPVTVHVVATGRHAALLLPCDDGRVVEYGYGAWDWYALGEDGWWNAPGTVLLPNQGTLGRRYLRGDDVAAYGARFGGDAVPLVVERTAAVRLLADLDAEFDAGSGVSTGAEGAPHFNADYGLDFVPSPRCYWMFHDCHDQMADWLAALGCDVSWAPVRTGIEVVR